jgi:hypothetical protein
MPIPNSANDQDNSRRRGDELDDRYGEIGIEAVAAAVRCRREERASSRGRRLPHDSD